MTAVEFGGFREAGAWHCQRAQGLRDVGDTLQPMTLDEYRSLVCSLPQPTLEQMEAFTHHVAKAHSWYKHLPQLPPGVPFRFFLDPCAGMDLIQHPDGTVVATPRETQGFHHSWVPTDHYRQHFGYLAFGQSAGPWVRERTETGAQTVVSDVDCFVWDARAGRRRLIPVEVFDAGTAFVSGIVFPAGPYWSLLAEAIEANPGQPWPAESGGAAALAAILARCNFIGSDISRIEWPDFKNEAHRKYLPSIAGGIDIPLFEATEPERRRQRNGMMAAMQRMVALVYGNES